MKKPLHLFLGLLFFISINLPAQEVSGVYMSAMDAYHNGNYVTANNIFNKLFSLPTIPDELYASAKYYSAESLLKTGEKNAAADGFDYLIKNFKWSAFRDKSLYELGMIYYSQENYTKSRFYLTQLLDEYPGSDFNGSALYWIGESFSKEKRYNDAISFLKQAISSPRNNRFVDFSIFTLANVYEKVGDYKNAVKYYDELLSYHRDSKLVKAAQIRIGIAYFKLKDYQSSILELNNPLVTSLPANQYAESLYLLANSYYRVKNYDKAIQTYMMILKKYPRSKVIREVNYGLAWSYFQQKKYNQAYNVFNSLSNGKDSIAEKSFYWKAESKRYEGRENEAFNLYKEFLLKFPDSDLSSGVQYQIGLLYFNDKKYDDAVKFLQEGIKSGDVETKAKSFTLLGEINLENKKFQEAIQEFNSVMNIKNVPENFYKRALLGLSSAYFYSKKYNDALNYLEKLNSEDSKFESDKTNFFIAECYFQNGKYDYAIQRYDLVSSKDKHLFGLALYGKAYCYYDKGNYDKAADEFSTFIKKNPDSRNIVDARLRLADSYYGKKDYAAARGVYKQLFNFDKSSISDPDNYYQYAQTLYKSGNIQEAINEFNTLQIRFPRSQYADKSLYIVGWIYFQQDNYSRAIERYRNVLEKYPHSGLAPIIYYSVGDAFFNLAEYDSAIANYQKVLIDYPTSSHVFDAVNGIQYSYIAKNQPEKAIGLIDEFVRQNPGLNFADQVYIKKGEIYYGLRQYDKAEDSYKDFITKFPKSDQIPEAYYWVGKSAENLKQYQEAIFNFNKVLEDYPKSESAAAAVIEMGNIYNTLKKYDDAIAILDKGIDKLKGSPRIPEIMFLKGRTLTNKGDLTNAYDIFNRVMINQTSKIFADKAKFELGLIELAAKRYNNATEYFQDLATKRSDDLGAKAQFYLGEVLFEQGKITDAISAYVRVRTIFSAYNEWLTRAFLRLGDCYIKLKDKRQAAEMYRTVLSKHKGDEYGKEAAKKLRKLR